jgi:transposase, IS6 family
VCALVSSIQAEPLRPGGDDGRTRTVAGTYGIMRWVWHCAPAFEKRCRRFARAVGRPWRADKTYVKNPGANGAPCIVPWIERDGRLTSG